MHDVNFSLSGGFLTSLFSSLSKTLLNVTTLVQFIILCLIYAWSVLVEIKGSMCSHCAVCVCVCVCVCARCVFYLETSEMISMESDINVMPLKTSQCHNFIYYNTDNIIIIIFIYCSWVVTRWQWLFYTYTEYETGY